MEQFGADIEWSSNPVENERRIALGVQHTRNKVMAKMAECGPATFLPSPHIHGVHRCEFLPLGMEGSDATVRLVAAYDCKEDKILQRLDVYCDFPESSPRFVKDPQ